MRPLYARRMTVMVRVVWPLALGFFVALFVIANIRRPIGPPVFGVLVCAMVIGVWFLIFRTGRRFQPVFLKDGALVVRGTEIPLANVSSIALSPRPIHIRVQYRTPDGRTAQVEFIPIDANLYVSRGLRTLEELQRLVEEAQPRV
jgi:hypothetical protein